MNRAWRQTLLAGATIGNRARFRYHDHSRGLRPCERTWMKAKKGRLGLRQLEPDGRESATWFGRISMSDARMGGMLLRRGVDPTLSGENRARRAKRYLLPVVFSQTVAFQRPN